MSLLYSVSTYSQVAPDNRNLPGCPCASQLWGIAFFPLLFFAAAHKRDVLHTNLKKRGSSCSNHSWIWRWSGLKQRRSVKKRYGNHFKPLLFPLISNQTEISCWNQSQCFCPDSPHLSGRLHVCLRSRSPRYSFNFTAFFFLATEHQKNRQCFGVFAWRDVNCLLGIERRRERKRERSKDC